MASEATTYAFMDTLGSRALGANRRDANLAAARAVEGAERMDPVAARRQEVARRPPIEAPEPSATITFHPVLREAAQAEAARPLSAPRQAEQQASPKAQHEAMKIALAGAQGFKRAV